MIFCDFAVLREREQRIAVLRDELHERRKTAERLKRELQRRSIEHVIRSGGKEREKGWEGEFMCETDVCNPE